MFDAKAGRGMPSRTVVVSDTAPAAGIAEIDVVERASPDQTTTTAGPGSGGMTLAVTASAKVPGRGCVGQLVGGV
jgi:hypothetical protein